MKIRNKSTTDVAVHADSDCRGSADHRKARRRIGRLVAGLAAAGVMLLGASEAAHAVQIVSYSGTTGQVVGYGHQLCNPFLSGVASRYVQIEGPVVAETPLVRPRYVGGRQQIYWQPQLQKWVGDRWLTVWTGGWYGETGFIGGLHHLQHAWVDVYAIANNGGAGYYRSSGTVWWVANAEQAGGWINYRLTEGNYFKDHVANPWGAYSTPVETPYCFAG